MCILNKYVVSIAPFSTPACPDCSQNITETENCSFCMFSLFNFSSIFPGQGHLPLCADARATTPQDLWDVSLHLWRSWGPSVSGPLPPFAIFGRPLKRAPSDLLAKFRGKGKKHKEQNGWNMRGATTGDGEDTEKERVRRPPHVTSPPTFQPLLHLWLCLNLNMWNTACCLDMKFSGML